MAAVRISHFPAEISWSELNQPRSQSHHQLAVYLGQLGQAVELLVSLLGRRGVLFDMSLSWFNVLLESGCVCLVAQGTKMFHPKHAMKDMANEPFGIMPWTSLKLGHVQNIPPSQPQFPVEPPPTLPNSLPPPVSVKLFHAGDSGTDDKLDDDVDDPKPTRKSSKRREKRLQDQAALQLFLETHGFAGVNGPRKPKRRLIPRPSCLFSEEEVLYPVHVAAQGADARVLKLLLRFGAKKDQRTSKGRTPLELASIANRTENIEILMRIPRLLRLE